MRIHGIIKTSTVDYPKKIATTIFLKGCNFNCEYCHNYELISPLTKTSSMSQKEVIEFLKKRKHVIDGICISGGEPTIHGDNLIKFMKKIKSELGSDFLIKLDTNGSNPEFINDVKWLVDYVALDFKSLDYSEFSNIGVEEVLNTLERIKNWISDYEVRITMYPGYIKRCDFKSIAELLSGVKRVSLQQYEPSYNGVKHTYSMKTIKEFAELLSQKVENVVIR